MLFGKAKKHASRVGLRPVKALFSIQIVSVTLPRSTPIVDQAILSTCVERGGKISATRNVTYDKPAFVREVVVDFNEKVELMATLYKDFKTGRYQEKQALLILREQTKHRFGHDSYKGWGRYNLNLHELLNELGFERTRSKEMVVKLELMIGVTMKIIVTSTIVSTGKENDETMSVSSYMSDTSEMSTLAASFSHIGNSKQTTDHSTIHTSSLENTVEREEEASDNEDAEEPEMPDEAPAPAENDTANSTANSSAYNTANSTSPRTFASYFSNPFGATTTNTFDYKSDKYSIPESPASGHEVEVSSEQPGSDISKGHSASDQESDPEQEEPEPERSSGAKQTLHANISIGKGPAPSTAVLSGEKSTYGASSYGTSNGSQVTPTVNSPQLPVHTTSTSSTSPTVVQPHPATTRQRFQGLLSHRSTAGAGASASGSSGVVQSDTNSSSSPGEHSPRVYGWGRQHRQDSGNHSEGGDADDGSSVSSPQEPTSASTEKDKAYKKGFFSRVMKPLKQHNKPEASEGPPNSVDTTYHSPGPELPQPNSARSHSSEASKEAFAIYDKELQRRGEHIARLEQAIADQAARSTAQIAALKTELATTAAALRKERVARAVIAEVTHKGDDLLAAALSEARDEAARATAERTAVLEELQGLHEERARHGEQVAQLRRQQAQEMELSQQAAAVAASASVRRAEAEDEVQQLVDQLITVKMEHANLSMELDDAHRTNSQLHRRLQSYAAQVAALEVKYAHLLQHQQEMED